MSHGNGAFGDKNSASGSSGAQYGVSPIRSLPSAPSPCSRITRQLGLPPDAGGRDGPDSLGVIAAVFRKVGAKAQTYRKDSPAVTRGGAGYDRHASSDAVCPEPDRIPASRPR